MNATVPLSPKPLPAQGFDVIGDIHGHAEKLEGLLTRLGYGQSGGRWRPPVGRQAVFLGDLIDRGPNQLKVLRTVRAMVEAGDALAILGNHEFNAIGWATDDERRPGRALRDHNPQHRAQHAQFLSEVGEGSVEHRGWIEWFKTLRPALDLGGLRVVHAWWHQAFVDHVNQAWPCGVALSDGLVQKAFRTNSALNQSMKGLTKGLEVPLPRGVSFLDPNGDRRTKVRVRWWAEGPMSYREAALVGERQRNCIPSSPLPFIPQQVGGPKTPTLVGHYWMHGLPRILGPKIACLDWSAGKDGPLVAYRWDGEDELSQDKLISTKA